MAVIFYNIFLWLYNAAISVAAVFNPKAKLWKKGRAGIFKKLQQSISSAQPLIWMHCASLGEFEQGSPVLEQLRKEFINHKILLTFFSPSGYEIRKNYNGADWVFYMPLDNSQNVKRFLDIVKPSLAIFVKYEYWYNYLKQLNKREIPVILISAIFRQDKIFFKWYGSLHRKMMSYFQYIFVQDEESKKLLAQIIPAEKIITAGDTRFDRVAEIANAFEHLPVIEKFISSKKVIVAGSTWPDDEKNLAGSLSRLSEKTALIIAPHEVSEIHIKFLQRLFPNNILYSHLTGSENMNISTKNVLIINAIGILSKLYYYADVAYIGGGFNKSGIHNTLEAAVYNKPVIFGPNYQKFIEAVTLINNGGGFSYSDENQLTIIINNFLKDNTHLEKSGMSAGTFVKVNTGATGIILEYIRQIVS